VPRILFIAAHRPGRSPSQRYRFEQYLDFLAANGFVCDFSYLLSVRADEVFYRRGHLLDKLLIFVAGAWKRYRDTARAGGYDIVFVQREAFMAGSIWFEKKFAASPAKLVFDFDDAIWQLDVSAANRRLGWLKRAAKTAEIIALSDLVIAGNGYLADYARRHNDRVVVIPSTIDTREYVPIAGRGSNGPICIGWTGSMTTIKHFETAVPILARLKQRYGDRIRVKVIGDGSYVNEALAVRGIPWRREDEVAELAEIDIGIMPLPDDGWTRGKCGLKGLQYMALGVPAVMSPVGVNAEIVADGRNGFLANSTAEWLEKLALLIESAELRARLGAAGRQTVEDRYSVRAMEPVYLKALRSLCPGS
jgi:glycosyltransferase involved in cell wall biosynthesis